MRHFLFAVAIGFAFIGGRTSQAALGDDADAIENVYGAMVRRHLFDDGTLGVWYHQPHDRYLHYVLFEKRVSVMEGCARVDGGKLSQAEIARFLKLNTARGTKWAPAGSGSDECRLVRSDGALEAITREVDNKPAVLVKRRKKLES